MLTMSAEEEEMRCKVWLQLVQDPSDNLFVGRRSMLTLRPA